MTTKTVKKPTAETCDNKATATKTKETRTTPTANKRPEKK